MSDFKVSPEVILAVHPHPNADRLEIVEILGWTCVVYKGVFRVGDRAMYFPIDSILPEGLEQTIFEGSKVTLHGHRVRSIKIRGALSQGLVVQLETLGLEAATPGKDYSMVLGVSKHEPPAPCGVLYVTGSPKHRINLMQKYTDIGNWKNYPSVFTGGELIVITEKLHGTNFRAGWIKVAPRTWFEKTKAYFGYFDPWKFCYGSRNVELQNQKRWGGFYETNVYVEVVKRYNLTKLQKGYVVYGEIVGDGIQKGYTYGCTNGEHKLAVFDILVEISNGNHRYLDYVEMDSFSHLYDLPVVPLLYTGQYEKGIETVFAGGPSVYDPLTHVREGCVIRSMTEKRNPLIGRMVLKRINDEYLLMDQSDNH